MEMEQDNLASYFREFSSIENLNNRTIKQLEKNGYLQHLTEWIAMEKIHGANFSFITDGTSVIIAKRSGIIAEKENFYNSSIILEKYRDDIISLYQTVKSHNPETTTIQVFGEIFGGYYPGYPSSTKPIQRGVYYKPEIDFLVFDIKMNTNIKAPKIPCEEESNSSSSDIQEENYYSWFLSQDEIVQYMKGLISLRSIPILARGKFSEIININPVFITTIPELYNLPKINNNMAEGHVFKTNCRHPSHRLRPIVKNKNINIFSEINYVPKTNIDENKIDKLSEQVISYCTRNRFFNTISKIGLDNRIEKISGIYVSDVLKDFEKDLQGEQIEEFKKSVKKIKEKIIFYLRHHNYIEIWLDEYHEPINSFVL